MAYSRKYYENPVLFTKDILNKLNVDGIHYINNVEGVGSNAYGIADNNKIKLADLITYDDNNNMIPLSKRFNFNINDVRYNNGK